MTQLATKAPGWRSIRFFLDDSRALRRQFTYMFFALPIEHHVGVSVVNRVLAKMIDLLIVILVAGIVLYPLGPLIGFVYSVVGDSFNFGPFRSQSIGKKIMKLQAIKLPGRTRITWKDAAYRNAPVGVATFFAIIPVWGWIILLLVGVPLMAMEIYLMLSVERGHRLGDVMGDTEVIELHSASA